MKTWHIGTQLGYDFKPVENFVLTPSIGLTWIKSKSDGHTRTQNGATQAYYGGTNLDSLLLPIEIAARYNIDFSNCSRLMIEGNIGYSYNFKNDSADAGITLAGITNGGNRMYIRGLGREQERHTFNVGAGLRYTFNRFDIGVKYDYYLQSDADAHRVMGTVGVSF